MGWVLQLVETGVDGRARSVEVLEISRPNDLGDIANLGLTLPEAKQLLARVQQAVVAAQAHQHAVLRPDCSSCGGRCHVKDWRPHQVATLLGGGDRAAAAISLHWLWPHRDGHQLAFALPVDTGAGPAPSAPFRPHALSRGGWRADASSAGRGRKEPRDIARPYAQGRGAIPQRRRGQTGGRGADHHHQLGLDFHP